MPCYGPLTGYYGAELGASGKRPIVFDKRKSFSGVPISIPCGQCIGCRLERSRQWAMRLMHEKRAHKRSCFLTLTYDNEHLPEGGTLVKRDLQLFMKRLRKSHGDGIRFYACGEYGDLNMRPHYHVILFGDDFADKRKFSQNRRGDVYFVSDELRELWPLGHNVIGEANWDTMAYVARYVLKKITGDRADDHYTVYDADGRCYDRLPEFTVMSRRPGIGTSYLEKYKAEMLAHDSVIVNGREVGFPRFYGTKFELTDAKRMAILKRERKRSAVLQKADNTGGLHGRLSVKEAIQRQALTRLKRNV